MDSVWWLFLVCAVVLCTVMAGATDAPLEQGRINQLSVCLSVCLSVMIIYFLDRTNAHFCNKLKRQQLN